MISTDIILPALDVTSKKHLFLALSTEAAPKLHLAEEDALAALLNREKIGSTGIGNGAAIPHVKLPGITQLYTVLARLKNPVDYDAPDDIPVDVVVMLLAPADSKTTQHLQALAQVSRFLKDSSAMQALRAANDETDIRALLDSWTARPLF